MELLLGVGLLANIISIRRTTPWDNTPTRSQISETLDKVSVLTYFTQSQSRQPQLSVLTSLKITGVDKSWSSHLYTIKGPVLMSLGLDIYEISESWWISVLIFIKFPSLYESWYQKYLRFQSWAKKNWSCPLWNQHLLLYSWYFCALDLGTETETQIILVSVSHLKLRFKELQSWSWSHYWSRKSNLILLIPDPGTNIPSVPQKSLPFLTSISQAPNIAQKKFSTRNESMDILFQKHKFKIF